MTAEITHKLLSSQSWINGDVLAAYILPHYNPPGQLWERIAEAATNQSTPIEHIFEAVPRTAV